MSLERKVIEACGVLIIRYNHNCVLLHCILSINNNCTGASQLFKKNMDQLCLLCFQELIQNAEDAGATEVRFLYDETQYGTESLWSKDMAQYQGKYLFLF